MSIKDRRRGCLYGLGIGDALGAAVEFKAAGTFSPVTCYRSGGPHSLAKGQWTDDTSMALALADSLSRGWDLDDQLTEYLAWWQTGKYSVNHWCFDIGCTTSTALAKYESSRNYNTCASEDPNTSGNGSIMRLAPVIIKFFDVPNVANLAAASSGTTHASTQCKDACKLMAEIVASLIGGETKEFALEESWKNHTFCPEIQAIAEGSYKFKNPPEIKGSGWVVESLEAALWAFYNASNFEECVLSAVNLGDDADTTGAVAGQFAGAYWGESGIPESLRNGLDQPEMFEKALIDLGVEPSFSE